ncbi:lysophospholipase [Galdieria sulphuraria]|uniref:Lysophospholipase n=1 Tax=Galdieria sulphuraria TaxID=130081 RepID=M2Y2K9_GALSU|nr:lysophospholipase [Galdieria sulphuraria]EME30188.1 lysophospholipase [Galdieria sulphuraria]|eukprot:XP_005706708.1 lysophospholipase [Galdieria sulphuraria]
MLTTFGCLAHLSYFTKGKDLQECMPKKLYLKRVETCNLLSEKLTEEEERRDYGVIDTMTMEDPNTQALEQVAQYGYMIRKENSCFEGFMLDTQDSFAFCCFDSEGDSEECVKSCLQRETSRSPPNTTLSGAILLPFRTIFVAYKRPSLDLSPSNCRKAPLLSSPSMEAIRSPLLYSYEYLSMKDSSRLFLQRWKSLENNTKLVLVVHDVISYGSFACLRLIPTLVNSGYDLVTFDLRGHGRSTENEIEESNLQYLSGCETWSSDLHEVILHVLGKFETPERKVNSLFLYGEGFGASIVLDYVIRYSQHNKLPWQVKGVIACGVMFRQIPSRYNNNESASRIWKQLSRKQKIFENVLLFQKFLWLLGQILPSTVYKMRVDPTQWGLVPLDLSLLSRDLRVIDALRGDLFRLRDIAFQHVLTLWELSHQLEKLLKKGMLCRLCPNISFGFFHGGDDILSSPSNLSLIESGRQIQVFVYEKARHYLSHETLPVRRQFLDDMLSWLDRQSH